MSILHVNQTHMQGEIYVGHHKLLPEHLKTNGFQMSQAKDGTVELETANYLYLKFPVSRLINAKKLIQTLN